MSSVEGFTADRAIYDSGPAGFGTRIENHAFRFPDTAAYEGITGELTLRVYLVGGTWGGKRLALGEFALGGVALGQDTAAPAKPTNLKVLW
jgi:hypothetical protein